MQIEVNGYSKEITDEIVFLVKYLVDLRDEGFNVKEIFSILNAVVISVLEGHQLKESSLDEFFETIKSGFKRTREHRIKNDMFT